MEKVIETEHRRHRGDECLSQAPFRCNDQHDKHVGKAHTSAFTCRTENATPR